MCVISLKVNHTLFQPYVINDVILAVGVCVGPAVLGWLRIADKDPGYRLHMGKNTNLFTIALMNSQRVIIAVSGAVQKLVGFWRRYESLNLKVAFVLISLQLVHLYWLTADVVVKMITGESALSVSGPLLAFFIVIDYIEIPALIAGLTYYALNIYKREKAAKNALLLAMLAVQVFHIFWITDEVVYNTFFGTPSAFEIPYYAAWVAILIDYLELPVIADLFYRTIIKGERGSK